MPSVIVFPKDSGIAVAIPADPSLSIHDAAALVVPPLTPWRTVESGDLPQLSMYRDAWTANFDDEPCVVAVDPDKAAAIDAATETVTADQWFESQVHEGFVTEDDWGLGITDSDVALLTGNYILAKEAAAMGLPLPPVIDRAGVVHQFESIEDLTMLMLAYGQHRAQVSAEYAARKAAEEQGAA